MIRENQRYLNSIQVLLDIFVIYLSFILAFYFRFYILNDGQSSFTLQQSLMIISCLIPVYLFLYSWFDLYTSRRVKPFTTEALSIIGTNILAIFLLVAVLYVFKEINFSRHVLWLFPTICSITTIFYRGFLRYCLRHYRKQGYNLKHCLVIGTAPIASELIYKIRSHNAWGYSITGCVRTDDRKTGAFCGYRILGNIDDLEAIFEEFHLDIVMIATDEHDATNLGHILSVCEKAGVKVNIIPYYYKYVPAKPYMDDLDGLPIIDTRHIPLDNLFKDLLKRLFDIVFSLAVIILLSPLFIFSAVMVKLTSPGPILFKQERVGRDRKSFYMYKFRSMRVQTADEEVTQWTTENDPRKTWWGNVMRKTSIDEFPQFFNVLKGDMSVIGPRPERPYFVDKFKEEIPRYMIKHQVRPGITGWAQVNGFRGDTSIEGRIEYDLYYIENWTFSLDIRIIFLTIFKGFINKNAY
ncbi:MAG: undecaprenyl-phosphate glucose phosphotransferase [Cellulosilyticum sp.]|nr:undecaprenyl-phosphate glucose phosphotransferase [Cellulosilyticum sp.]